MSQHHASCHCGNLQAFCEGGPDFVGICHCEACQRRTGSAFNLGAWFKKGSVRLEGNYKTYRRTGDQGTEIAYHFCPECGSNVYWEVPSMKAMVGIAAGCFADAEFPQPTIAFYDKRRHPWVSVPEGIPCFQEGAGGR